VAGRILAGWVAALPAGAWAVSVLFACAAPAAAPRSHLADRASTGAPDFVAAGWPEADRLFHRNPRWLGADAAFSVDLGGERVLWLFGDTFVATGAHRVRRESRMVHNSIAVQRGLDPSAASIDFHWGETDGVPASWLPEDGERWFWPAHGVRIPGGPLVLFWSCVRATPGEGLGFRAEGWLAVLVENPDDPPGAWLQRTLRSPPWPAGLLAAQGLRIAGEFVEGLAIREPGDHGGFALRIPSEALARGELDAFQWWDGAWVPTRADLTPTAVIADAGPELSLSYHPDLGGYVHVKSLGFGASTVALSTAPRLTGPWSAPRALFRPPECDRERPFVYAAKAHPELLGADLVVTYACNSFDFAELVADTSLYYPRFVRLMRAP
jgi:hypothetical protein